MPDARLDQLAFLPAESSTAITTTPRPPATIPSAVPYAPPTRRGAMAVIEDDERAYWVAWNRVRGIGPVRFAQLLDVFGDAATAWVAPATELRGAGLDERLVAKVIQQRAALDPERELRRLDQFAVVALTLRDASYPRLLREIPQPPAVLYVRGELLPEDEIALAIVGTRKISAYGKQITHRFATACAEQGLTIVSGLARGVDFIAHSAVLEAGGRTIAVLGCGPDLVYPPEHATIASRIVDNGAVVSEFPVGVQPEASNFPARNRIISGLALAVLITEAPETSGALITADFAAEQGRDVLAVPGNIVNQGSKGCNKLIQNGAHCVTAIEDIMCALNVHLLPQQLDMRTMLPTDATETELLRLLETEPLHVDDLCHAAQLPAAIVSGTLVMLELKGYVRNLGNMIYGRI